MPMAGCHKPRDKSIVIGMVINMFEMLEAVMVISFGISWPMSILKSYQSRTAKGKSLFFLFMIWIGYVAGTAWKVTEFLQTGVFRYPSFFYILNLLMVSTDIVLYFRNRRLDKQNEKAE